MEIEALFISDVHIGSRGCNSDELLHILNHYQPKQLIIVGDFIDGWLLKRRYYWIPSYTKIIKRILEYSQNGTKVVYVTGNHDDFFREYTPILFGGNIRIVNDHIWNNYYITHGDLYDGVVKLKWLGKLGGFGYEVAIWLDRLLKKLGYRKSLSKWLKKTVKDAVKFITNFEDQLAYQAKQRGCEGVIAGHIHTPTDRLIKIGDDEIRYLNCGDWIENNSYIIYNDGKFTIKYSDTLEKK
jgi:UDP-2,3-diacylglucosamine pyrophosphatase LpxH